MIIFHSIDDSAAHQLVSPDMCVGKEAWRSNRKKAIIKSLVIFEADNGGT